MERVKRARQARTRRLPVETARRLRIFFARLGVSDEIELKRLVRRFAAKSLVADDALAQAEAETATWFAVLLGLEGQGLQRGTIIAAGRLAWLTAGAARRWPGTLLSDRAPVALTAALLRVSPALAPMVLKSPMPAANLDPVALPAPAIFAWLRTRARIA